MKKYNRKKLYDNSPFKTQLADNIYKDNGLNKQCMNNI